MNATSGIALTILMDSYDKSSPAQRHTNLLEWFIDETGASESPVNLYRPHLQLHLIQRLKQNVKGERSGTQLHSKALGRQFVRFCGEGQTASLSPSLPSVYQFVRGAGKTARTAPVASLN